MTQKPAEIFSGLAGSILTLAIVFGVSLTDEQTAAILALIGWLPLIITLCVNYFRGHKTPPPPPLPPLPPGRDL